MGVHASIDHRSNTKDVIMIIQDTINVEADEVREHTEMLRLENTNSGLDTRGLPLGKEVYWTDV